MSPKNLLVNWNNSFPLDRVYRKKYNIAIHSEAHRDISQVDVYLDWLEDELYDDLRKEIEEGQIREQEMSQGNWLRLSNESEEALFEKLKI